MATPKKYYSVEFGSIDHSSCRLCGIVVDQHYCEPHQFPAPIPPKGNGLAPKILVPRDQPVQGLRRSGFCGWVAEVKTLTIRLVIEQLYISYMTFLPKPKQLCIIATILTFAKYFNIWPQRRTTYWLQWLVGLDNCNTWANL